MGYRFFLALSASLVALACGGGSSGGSPTAPTGAATVAPQTRTITVTGSLAFGEVVVGSSKQLTFAIGNSGNATLTISRLTTFGLTGDFTTSWSAGTIPPGSSQAVVVTFAPTSAGAISGGLIVNGDQNGGNSNTVSVTGTALPSVGGSWVGAHVIRQCNGTGSAQDLICSPQRGVNRIGDLYSFSATLSQNNTVVTGTINVGGITGPVTGVVTTSGLTLRGSATTASGYNLVLTDWRTTTDRNSMAGTLSYDLTFRGLNGVAAVVSALERVVRQ